MKIVTIELPDTQDQFITFTVLGRKFATNPMNVAIAAFDLSKGTYIAWDEPSHQFVQMNNKRNECEILQPDRWLDTI